MDNCKVSIDPPVDDIKRKFTITYLGKEYTDYMSCKELYESYKKLQSKRKVEDNQKLSEKVEIQCERINVLESDIKELKIEMKDRLSVLEGNISENGRSENKGEDIIDQAPRRIKLYAREKEKYNIMLENAQARGFFM